MDKIAALPKETAQLIAAGEVVERPESVVKELVENSIDAGATVITVDITDGGISGIRVQDNGSGMSERDARVCFLRHATSKVRSAEDIYRVHTLGFRGEALASIAAVGKVRLVTKRAEDETGSLVRMEGGELVEQSPFGCPDGTIITVSELFYNTPARKKFLRSVRSEAGAIFALIDRLALSHPEISFRLLSQGKEELFTPGDGVLRNAIYAVLGAKTAESVLPVKYDEGGVSVGGFITKPLFARGNRGMQYFFINKRIVQSKTLYAALDAAYKGSIMVGKFPGCVLNIDVDPAQVDVNVHPTKSVVKFSDESAIFNHVLRAVYDALSRERQHLTARLDEGPAAEEKPAFRRDLPPSSLSSFGAPAGGGAAKDGRAWEEPPAAQREQLRHTAAVTPASFHEFGTVNSFSDSAKAQPSENMPQSVILHKKNDPVGLPVFLVQTPPSPAERPATPPAAADTRPADPPAEQPALSPGGEALSGSAPAASALPTYIGEALQTYLIAQRDDEVYFVDKHAAHERVLYDQLAAAGDSPVSQLLLLSRTVQLGKREKSALLENIESLERCGFDIGDFGGGMLTVRAVPQILDDDDIETALAEIADELLAGKDGAALAKVDKIRAVTACKAAVKAGQRNDPLENERLLEQLFSSPEQKYCPHGRPLIYTLTRRDFEKFFKRVI